jgi:HAE1 family hydrophobic/amphiphilic exporter-1
MNAYEISADSIVKALKEQNIEAAPGDGWSSGRQEKSLQYVLRYTNHDP